MTTEPQSGPFLLSGFCVKIVNKYENRVCPKFSFSLYRGRIKDNSWLF